MNSRSEEFRAQAAECLELASRWRDEGKRQYEELARQWLRLAEQAAGQRPEQLAARADTEDATTAVVVQLRPRPPRQ